MVDPEGAAKQAFDAVKPEGAIVLIEPLAADKPGLENALQVPVRLSIQACLLLFTRARERERETDQSREI